MKKKKKAVTLAIGDGANDVGMIKGTHIQLIVQHNIKHELFMSIHLYVLYLMDPKHIYMYV